MASNQRNVKRAFRFSVSTPTPNIASATDSPRAIRQALIHNFLVALQAYPLITADERGEVEQYLAWERQGRLVGDALFTIQTLLEAAFRRFESRSLIKAASELQALGVLKEHHRRLVQRALISVVRSGRRLPPPQGREEAVVLVELVAALDSQISLF